MLQDILVAMRQTLGSLALPIRPGQSAALAVGSRGIVNIDVIAKAAVEHVKALGARRLIFCLRSRSWSVRAAAACGESSGR